MAELRQFAAGLKSSKARGQASRSVLDFLESNNEEWQYHDVKVDAIWDAFVEKVTGLSEGAIERGSFAKPSGPLSAVLSFQWHYPTWSTKKPYWGFVMDPTNPSLRAQDKRIAQGSKSFVRTQDTFPIRHHFIKEGIPWDSLYDNWAEIKASCLEMARTFNRQSKILVVLGRENFENVKELVGLDDDEELDRVELGSGPRLYDQQAHFHPVRGRSENEIRRIVLLSYHSQTFFHSGTPQSIRAYHDLIWNAACSMAGIDLDKVDVLQRVARGKPHCNRWC